MSTFRHFQSTQTWVVLNKEDSARSGPYIPDMALREKNSLAKSPRIIEMLRLERS